MGNNENKKPLINYILKLHRRMNNVISPRSKLENEVNQLTNHQFSDILCKCQLPELRLMHYKLTEANKLQTEASQLLLQLL